MSGYNKPSKTIAILGLPNTGKSTIFNHLTKEYTLVANLPFTTVEMKRAQFDIKDQSYEIVDTPGLHCLYIHSEEELAVRDMLFSKRPDIIIQCIDANRLKRSLVLTADLLELGIPMVISLNSIEETTRRGTLIDSLRLSNILGVPVVETDATSGIGIQGLKDAIEKANITKKNIEYGSMVEGWISSLKEKLPKDIISKHKLSILLLLHDPFLPDYLKRLYPESKVIEIKNEVSRIRRQFRGNISRLINNKRNIWVDDIYKKIIKKQNLYIEEFSQTFARLSRHPVFGIPILIFFLVTTYLLVVYVAGFLDSILSVSIVDPSINYISKIVPVGFWSDLLIGDYGILTLGLFNAFVTVLPILSVFFLMFGFLEDVGYIPNLCVLTKKIFEKIGLTGRSIMPLVLGFGCKTMATLVTRGLQSYKEKFIAIYLIAFAIPCAAQFAVDMAILGRVGVGAFFIAYGFLILVEIAAGFILNKVIKDDDKSDFIQELPAIRIPDPKAIFKKTYFRLYWFLKKAIPVFIIASLVLFLFERVGILDFTKSLLEPVVVGWLGLPIDIVDALILSLARHEIAAAVLINMVDQGVLNYIQVIVAVTITTMFVPCFANIVAMCKEMGIKTGMIMTILINVSSFVLAGLLNWILIFTIGKFVL